MAAMDHRKNIRKRCTRNVGNRRLEGHDCDPMSRVFSVACVINKEGSKTMQLSDVKYAFVAFIITNSFWIYFAFNYTWMVFQQPPVTTVNRNILTFYKPRTLLTLFTTWNSSMENENVYINTLHMWTFLGPEISLVLFTDNAKLKRQAKSYGWDAQPMASTTCNNTPILKDMFLSVITLYDSQFYGYSNSDILYDHGLNKTLNLILENMDILKNSPVLITGRRIDSSVGLNETIRSWKDFDVVTKRGNMSNAFALDYFIMTKGFKWLTFPDLVVGRPIIDNWLIFHARSKGVVIVDASASITALHQKTSKRKKQLRECNRDILSKIKELKFKKINVLKGNAECAQYETRYDRSGTLLLLKRGLYSTGC